MLYLPMFLLLHGCVLLLAEDSDVDETSRCDFFNTNTTLEADSSRGRYLVTVTIATNTSCTTDKAHGRLRAVKVFGETRGGTLSLPFCHIVVLKNSCLGVPACWCDDHGKVFTVSRTEEKGEGGIQWRLVAVFYGGHTLMQVVQIDVNETQASTTGQSPGEAFQISADFRFFLLVGSLGGSLLLILVNIILCRIYLKRRGSLAVPRSPVLSPRTLHQLESHHTIMSSATRVGQRQLSAEPTGQAQNHLYTEILNHPAEGRPGEGLKRAGQTAPQTTSDGYLVPVI